MRARNLMMLAAMMDPDDEVAITVDGVAMGVEHAVIRKGVLRLAVGGPLGMPSPSALRRSNGAARVCSDDPLSMDALEFMRETPFIREVVARNMRAGLGLVEGESRRVSGGIADGTMPGDLEMLRGGVFFTREQMESLVWSTPKVGEPGFPKEHVQFPSAADSEAAFVTEEELSMPTSDAAAPRALEAGETALMSMSADGRWVNCVTNVGTTESPAFSYRSTSFADWAKRGPWALDDSEVPYRLRASETLDDVLGRMGPRDSITVSHGGVSLRIGGTRVGGAFVGMDGTEKRPSRIEVLLDGIARFMK